MKYSQDHAFLPSSTNRYELANDNAFNDFRIKSLEQRVESLEKQLKLYEQMYIVKGFNVHSSQGDFDDTPIQEVYRRIVQLEEEYAKIGSNSYSLLNKVDIDKVISYKFAQEQIKTNLKLNDMALKVKDLSQYNERQQIRYETFQDSLIQIDKFISDNTMKIKELTNQLQHIRDIHNDNSKEEELFLKNISSNNTSHLSQ